jgi:hypothetical protein
MSALNRTNRRLRRRDPLQNFKHRIAMPSYAIKRAAQLVGDASRFRLIFHRMASISQLYMNIVYSGILGL